MLQNKVKAISIEKEVNMGRISKFTCPVCNRSWQLRLGHGIGHAVLESVLGVFPMDIQQKILADTQGEQIPSFEFNYRPAICGRCEKVVSIPSIYLQQRGDVYSAKCPDCEGDVTIVEENSEIACPHCKKGALLAEETGSWD